MLKETLNKGISTPIAIGIVLVLVIIVGGFTWWQYGEMWKETSELPEIEVSEKETFTVYLRQEEPQVITVNNVSIPLDESEAIRVFEAVQGKKPACYVGEEKQECPITKTDKGWEIISGYRYLSDIYFIINEEDKTINIKGGY